MAKNRRKKSSKCPEPFNTLIDIAAAATLNYISYKRSQKRGGKKRSKIDPYAAAGIAMGMGKLNSTEDIIKLGGFLGAMGAFDEDYGDDYTTSYTPRHTSSSRTYQPTIHKTTNKNRYAWRMNCENGSSYGIYPEHYETRDAYNTALNRAKFGEITPKENTIPIAPQEQVLEIDNGNFEICRISNLKDGRTYYCRPNEHSINVGNIVVIESVDGVQVQGVVVSIEKNNNILSDEEIQFIPKIIHIVSD